MVGGPPSLCYNQAGAWREVGRKQQQRSREPPVANGSSSSSSQMAAVGAVGAAAVAGVVQDFGRCQQVCVGGEGACASRWGWEWGACASR